VGFTNSADFPAIDPFQKSLRGTSDLFLTRLELPAMKMTFSTTFGGSGEDSGWGIAVDRRGNPVVGGITDSLDLPGTAESYQPTNHGNKDAFVASFQLRHGRRIRATYFGGSSTTRADTMEAMSNWTVTAMFGLSELHTQMICPHERAANLVTGGNGDGFVAAFDPLLRRLCFATYFLWGQGEKPA